MMFSSTPLKAICPRALRESLSIASYRARGGFDNVLYHLGTLGLYANDDAEGHQEPETIPDYRVRERER
jgi:hypothetical protein